MTSVPDQVQNELIGELCEQARQLASRDSRLSRVVLRAGDIHVELERGASDATAATEPQPAPALEPESAEPSHYITAPVVGTFYRAPEPGRPPFVEVGDPVEEGTVIGIVEAMKLMNKVTAGCCGVVKGFAVPDATPVEYDQPLLEVALQPAAPAGDDAS